MKDTRKNEGRTKIEGRTKMRTHENNMAPLFLSSSIMRIDRKLKQ